MVLRKRSVGLPVFFLSCGLSVAVACSSSSAHKVVRTGEAGEAGASEPGNPGAGGDGSTSTSGDAGSDAGSNANPFIGTWACILTVTDAESDGGSSVGPETLTITAGVGGEIRESSFLPDGTLICAVTSSTSNDTATLIPNQPCAINGQNIKYQSGTAMVSGDTPPIAA